MNAPIPVAGEAARRLAGPAGPVPARRLLVLTAQLVLTSDTTMGGGEGSEDDDIVVVRDPGTGRPLLPASTQAGLLRHHLTAWTQQAHRVEALFGTTEHTSAFSPRHAIATTAHTGRRDGNRVSPSTGRVERGGLFSMQVLPAGTVFPLCWEVDLGADPATQAEQVAAVTVLGEALAAGGIRLGHRQRRGRGAVTADAWRARVFDLSDTQDWQEWFTHPYPEQPQLLAALAPSPTITTALTAALGAELAGQTRLPDNRSWAVLTLQLATREWQPGPKEAVKVASTMVQGGPGTTVNGRSPLRRPTLTTAARADNAAGGDTAGTSDPVGVVERAVDSGAAVHSMLGRTARTILSTLAGGDPARDARAAALHTRLFGGQHPTTAAAVPSRIREDEQPFLGATPLWLTRNRIHPLTHAVVPGFLFVDEVLHGGHRQLRLELTDPTAAELALLGLILRDLAEGFGATTGAGASHGHGRRLLTTATVQLHNTPLGSPGFNRLSSFLTHLQNNKALPTLLAEIGGNPGDDAAR